MEFITPGTIAQNMIKESQEGRTSPPVRGGPKIHPERDGTAPGSQLCSSAETHRIRPASPVRVPFQEGFFSPWSIPPSAFLK